MRTTTSLERLARVQGVYYVATGMWPLVSMRSFERVTGPKREHWLVKTVGLLVAVVGGTLVMAATRRRLTPESAVLGAGSAAALAGVDSVYAARGRISRVYLLDAIAEVLLVVGWAALRDSSSPGGARGLRERSPDRGQETRAPAIGEPDPLHGASGSGPGPRTLERP